MRKSKRTQRQRRRKGRKSRDPKQLRMFGEAGHGQADLFHAVDTDVTVAYLDRGVRTIVRLPRGEARAFLRSLPRGAWTSETRRIARVLGLGRTSRDAGGFDKKTLLKQIDREQKIAARKKLRAMQEAVRAAVLARRSGRADVQAACALGRAEARTRIAALREELKSEMRRRSIAIRASARSSCEASRRAPGAEVARLRAELLAERRHLAAMRRIEAANRKKRPAVVKASVRRAESDDEVRQNIPPELVPLFERVKRQIKGSGRISRTEAFLHYVEEHPGEEFSGIEDETERMIREHERALRSGAYRDPGQRHRVKGAPTFRQQKLIARKIRILVREGRPQKQAVAIAYRMAGVRPRRAP